MKNNYQKKEIDMLNGSLWNKILFFSIPIALTGILEQLFNASDIAVVGNFTGSLKNIAVAAVGANSPIIGLVVNFFIGFSLGANVVIAKLFGENNKKMISKAVHTSIVFSFLSGIIIAIICEILSAKILNILKVPVDVYPYALNYLRIYFLGLPVILLYNFEAAIFRSIGKTKIPLITLAVSGAINVCLNLIFVIIFKMNVSGVALATVISNAISSIILFIILLRTNSVVKVNLKDLKISKQSLISIFKIGFPAGTQSALFAISNLIIQSAINSLGSNVMAGSSAAYNIEVFAYYIFTSFSQACTTFVSQNNGAKNYKRCRRAYFLCLLEDLIATILSIVIILLVGKKLLSIFNDDIEIVDIGYSRLIMVFSAYIFSMIYEVSAGYLRGYGKSLVPAILTAIGVCGVRIICIYTIFATHKTFNSILVSYPLSLSITAILLLIAVIIYHPTKKSIKLMEKSYELKIYYFK